MVAGYTRLLEYIFNIIDIKGVLGKYIFHFWKWDWGFLVIEILFVKGVL